MSSDIFVIYQIDNSEKNREYRCRSYEYQIQHGFMITADNYGTGYSGTATRGMGAEAIREKMESINPDKYGIQRGAFTAFPFHVVNDYSGVAGSKWSGGRKRPSV